jgi:hypothetical protein
MDEDGGGGAQGQEHPEREGRLGSRSAGRDESQTGQGGGDDGQEKPVDGVAPPEPTQAQAYERSETDVAEAESGRVHPVDGVEEHELPSRAGRGYRQASSDPQPQSR